MLAPLFKMLEACFELVVPLVVASMIDQGILKQDRSFAVWMCMGLIGLGLVGLAASLTAQYFSAKAATGFSRQLRHSLFSHLLKFSFSEIDQVGTSTMITRMTSDINQAQTGVNMFLRLFLRSPFVVLGAMVMAFTIDAKAALVFLVTIGILSLVVLVIMKVSIPRLRKVQKRLDLVMVHIRENLEGVRVLRAFGKQTQETMEFHTANQKLYRTQKKAGFVSALLNPLTMVLINAAIAALIHTGAIQVQKGILTQGQVVALYNYMMQILVELVKFANLIITINKSLASAKRIDSVFQTPAGMEVCSTGAINAEQQSSPASIEFCDVSLKYPRAGEEALSDISFRLKPGQTMGIIGGTGSGKTSLVHLIGRFYDVTKGAVFVDGKDVRTVSLEMLRSQIGIVMQKSVLFEGTIRENLAWGREGATDEELLSAIEAAQATEVVQKKGGLDARIQAGGKNLSGGQRQRLSIARALVRKPSILILDDSSSALDFATDRRLRKALSGLDWNPTTLIVSQRTSSLAHADQILVLEDGTMAGLGTHEQLLEECEIYKEIYRTCTQG